MLPLVAEPVSSRAVAKLSFARGFRTAAAEAMLILRFVSPPPTRVSVTAVPVLCRADRMLATEAVGFCCLSRAHAPATCGAAMEVPLKGANCWPPLKAGGTEELMPEPGARSERKEAELENEDMVSDFVVEPTLTALDIQAGKFMEFVKPLLPEAIAIRTV